VKIRTRYGLYNEPDSEQRTADKAIADVRGDDVAAGID
jgi:hypothetical protein